MYHVERSQALADKLVDTDSDMMFASVIAGNTPGEVWVDDPDKPSAALVWSAGLMCFQFMGDPQNRTFKEELNSFIEGDIITFLKEKDLNFFEFSADKEEWYQVIDNALPDRDIDTENQLVYKSDGKDLPDDITFPDSFQSVFIDEEFIYSLSEDNITNPDYLLNYIRNYWGTVDNYLEKGKGFVALKDDKIAAFAVSSSLYKKSKAIGVETLEEYRRQGLSSSLSRMLLQDFYREGYWPWWDCMKSNIPSQKTAEKVGLVRAYQYEVKWFRF